MEGMLLSRVVQFEQCSNPLELKRIQKPNAGEREIVLEVNVCGVCHTEIDEIEGRTPPSKFPIVPGHQVIGRVDSIGKNVSGINIGQRMGVGWIHSSCGKCEYCLSNLENLCSEFQAIGRDQNGGYAEYIVVPASSAFDIPDALLDEEAAPLLCAGAIGYRSLKLTGIRNGDNLGLLGFSASAHLVLKLVRKWLPDTSVYVFTRNPKERQFAIDLGATWSGQVEEFPPEIVHAIIDTTPVWKPIVKSLEYLKPGGRLVINAIRKENIDKEYLLNLDYANHLWLEKEIKSVANVTRNDIREFLKLAARYSIKPEYQVYALKDANQALSELKKGVIHGAKVLKIG